LRNRSIVLQMKYEVGENNIFQQVLDDQASNTNDFDSTPWMILLFSKISVIVIEPNVPFAPLQ